MPPKTAAGRLDSARAEIRQALSQWNAVDLERMDRSRELLSAAVADLLSFESAVRAGEIPPSEDLRARLVSIKTEVNQATRVVDACVAFHRGLLARSGNASPVYNAAGRIAGESSDLESEVHA